VQRHTGERLKREAAWFGAIPSASGIASFYQGLLQANAKLGADRCLLQLGWGTGWDGKTFGSRLRAHKGLLEKIVRDYRLTRGTGSPDRPFPNSRRVIVAFQRDAGGRIVEQPGFPPGWCLLEWKERT
jgi:CRISPR-associated protein Csm5